MPIITSTTRKDISALSQLIRYVSEQQAEKIESISLLHNITAKPEDITAIIKAFKTNNHYRKKRKGGIVLYHDIIAFHPKDKQAIENNPYILEDIARLYITERSPNGLAYAKIHLDKEHIHIHVVLSPNEKESRKSIRVSKKNFSIIRQKLERHQYLTYPELTFSFIRQSIRKHEQREKGRVR